MKIYLATPYSFDPDMGHALAVTTLAHAKTFYHNDTWISPIAMYHTAAVVAGLQTDADAWATHNKRLLESCNKVVVTNVDEWFGSRGIKAELEWAHELQMPTQFYHLDMNHNPRLFSMSTVHEAVPVTQFIGACHKEIHEYRKVNKSKFGNVAISSGFKGQVAGPAEMGSEGGEQG